MADTKISALTAATSVADADALPLVQGGSTKKVAFSVLSDAVRDYTGGSGVFFRAKGSDINTNATNFNFGVQTFEGVNADGRENNVVSIGWNIGANGAPEDAGEAAFRIAFEEHYIQGGYTIFEYHVECTDENGDVHRVYSVLAPKDGGDGSVAMYAADSHSFHDYDNNQRMKLDFPNDSIVFPGDPLRLTYAQNNAAFARQINAAGNTYINLPFLNAEDRLLSMANGAQFSGATPTTGAFANAFMAFQPTSIPHNGRAIDVNLPSVSGAITSFSAAGSATWYIDMYNANLGSGHARTRLLTLVAGGDPVSVYEASGSGGAAWGAGLDNSENDRFAISFGGNLGTDDRLLISKAGQVSIPTVGTGLSIAEGSNAKMGTATLTAGEATVSTTAVTASSRIFLTSQSDGGTPGFLRVSTRTAGTSFTIKSTEAADTSTVAWVIFEPA